MWDKLMATKRKCRNSYCRFNEKNRTKFIMYEFIDCEKNFPCPQGTYNQSWLSKTHFLQWFDQTWLFSIGLLHGQKDSPGKAFAAVEKKGKCSGWENGKGKESTFRPWRWQSACWRLVTRSWECCEWLRL